MQQYPNQPNGSPQQSYPQGQPPPPPNYSQQVPPVGRGAPTYRRRRSLSRFQVRIGILGLLGFIAGAYLIVTGQAVNMTAALGLIGGGGLVFALFILLPLLRSR